MFGERKAKPVAVCRRARRRARREAVGVGCMEGSGFGVQEEGSGLRVQGSGFRKRGQA
jgi:hypothetical protein